MPMESGMNIDKNIISQTDMLIFYELITKIFES